MNISRLSILLMISLVLFSCTSSQPQDYSYPQGINNNFRFTFQLPMLPDTTNVTPASYEEQKSKPIVPAIRTIHGGTLQDPVPIGEYKEWGIYHEDYFFDERTDYTVRMNVNYAIRGNQVLNLYNDYNNIEKATAITAVPMSEELKNRLAEKLQAVTGKKIILTNKVDESCIGGVVLEMNDVQYNDSIAEKLNSLKQQLKSIN